MSRWSRSLALVMTLAITPLSAGPVPTTPSTGHGEAAGASEALRSNPWLNGDGAKYQLHSARDIVIDTRRRTLMVFAVPAKHRKVVAMLQRIFAEPTDHPAPTLAPKVPPKPTGPTSTYKYQGEKVSTIIRDLAAEANLNLVIRGPEPTQTCDLTFKNVPTKDLLKLLLDVYNFNYQMSPNGETLVVFNGPVHRVMESYSIPPKVNVPLEEIAQALQSTILDVEEPYGPPVEEHHDTGVASDPVTVEIPAPGATSAGEAGTGAPESPPAPDAPDASTGGAIELSPSPADVPPGAPASAAPAASGASVAPVVAPSPVASPASP